MFRRRRRKGKSSAWKISSLQLHRFFACVVDVTVDTVRRRESEQHLDEVFVSHTAHLWFSILAGLLLFWRFALSHGETAAAAKLTAPVLFAPLGLSGWGIWRALQP
jgi:hypothetical protein